MSSTSTSSTSHPKPEKEFRSTPFFHVLEVVVLATVAFSQSPLPFPAVVLLAYTGAYLFRFLNNDVASPLLLGTVLFVVYSILLLLYCVLIYSRYFDPLLVVPGPTGHWLFGVNQIIRDEDGGVPQKRWVKEYDNPLGMISYYHLGGRRLVPYSPAALSYFLNTPNYVKPPRATNFIRILIGDGILTAEYEEHRRQRRILTPAFAISHIRTLTPHFWNKARQLVEVMSPVVESKPEAGIDVAAWLNRVTLDIIGVAGFGFDFNSLENEEQSIAKTYRHLFQPGGSTRLTILMNYVFPPFKYIPLPSSIALEKARSIVRNTALNMIRQKEGEGIDKMGRGEKDILGVMIEENRRNRENGIPHEALNQEEMVNQIMTFLAAGHETTSTAVTWALYLLSVHPNIQERLRNEVQDLDLDNPPSFEKLELFKYLNNVCREVLRFIPPVSMTIRQADRDDVYNGIKIRAGTLVFIPTLVSNSDPLAWGEDADQFNPNRWDSLPPANSNYSFMTFIQGPRSCIGRKFAETEMKCLLAALIATYKFEEVVPGRVVEKEAIITTRPKGGMPLRIQKVRE